MGFGEPKMPTQGEVAKNQNEQTELEKAKKEFEQLSDIEKNCVESIRAEYEIKMLLDKLASKLNIVAGEGSELEDVLEEIRLESSNCTLAAQRMLILASGEECKPGDATFKVERRLGHIANVFAETNQAQV